MSNFENELIQDPSVNEEPFENNIPTGGDFGMYEGTANGSAAEIYGEAAQEFGTD